MVSLYKDVEHVYDVIDIGRVNRQRLVEAGIKDLEDLENAKERLGRNEVGNVKGSVQTELYDVVCWCQEYEEQHGGGPHVMTRFTEEVLSDFQKNRKNSNP